MDPMQELIVLLKEVPELLPPGDPLIAEFLEIIRELEA